MSRPSRVELLLFTACFFAFGYFHQGGGWNQNARFAEVRAMVEEGRFAIDDYLVYEVEAGSDVLRRNPVQRGQYVRDDKRFELSWVDMDWNLFPVNGTVNGAEVEKAPMIEVCSSGDVSYVPATGHFHPNKPPGTSLLGLPAYLVLFHLERLAGWNPDHWWLLTVNAWLTTVGSVGLISALACVMFYRLALELSGGHCRASLLAATTFAFGTTFFPFATLFFDHALTASLLVACLYFLRCRRTGWAFALAGGAAGFAAVTNYIAAVAGVFLGLYALLATDAGKRNWRAALLYILGVAGPFLIICFYGWVCFGSPFKINNEFQNPLFKETAPALLGMFPIPQSLDAVLRLGETAALLLVSPFRGVFFFAPVLVLGMVGLVLWLKEKTHVAEARLCLAVFGFFFLVNVTFNGFHGGFAAGPRYLVPGIPFLALPLALAFLRWPRISCALASLSVGSQLLLTATDAQNPVGVGGHTRIEGVNNLWNYNLISDYALPLYLEGRAWPLLEAQTALEMEKERARPDADFPTAGERTRQAAELRLSLDEAIRAGEPSRLMLGTVCGPVSVNPIGMFEGLFNYGFFGPKSAQCRWASFNIGEFLCPESRGSLLPLFLVSGGLLAWALRLGGRKPAYAPTPRLAPDATGGEPARK